MKRHLQIQEVAEKLDTASKEPRRYDVSYVKKRLSAYRNIEREIDNQIERIENLESKMYTPSSPSLSGMPKSPSPSGDKIASQVAQKSELEEKVRSLIDYQTSERTWIEGILEHLDNPDQRAVIRMRYIDIESWHNVSRMLFGTKDDFYDKSDSYLRRTTKLHGNALVNMALYVAERDVK